MLSNTLYLYNHNIKRGGQNIMLINHKLAQMQEEKSIVKKFFDIAGMDEKYNQNPADPPDFVAFTSAGKISLEHTILPKNFVTLLNGDIYNPMANDSCEEKILKKLKILLDDSKVLDRPIDVEVWFNENLHGISWQRREILAGLLNYHIIDERNKHKNKDEFILKIYTIPLKQKMPEVMMVRVRDSISNGVTWLNHNRVSRASLSLIGQATKELIQACIYKKNVKLKKYKARFEENDLLISFDRTHNGQAFDVDEIVYKHKYCFDFDKVYLFDFINEKYWKLEHS